MTYRWIKVHGQIGIQDGELVNNQSNELVNNQSNELVNNLMTGKHSIIREKEMTPSFKLTNR